MTGMLMRRKEGRKGGDDTPTSSSSDSTDTDEDAGAPTDELTRTDSSAGMSLPTLGPPSPAVPPTTLDSPRSDLRRRKEKRRKREKDRQRERDKKAAQMEGEREREEGGRERGARKRVVPPSFDAVESVTSLLPLMSQASSQALVAQLTAFFHPTPALTPDPLPIPPPVLLSPLSLMPGYGISAYLGSVHLQVIKEAWNVGGGSGGVVGGLGGFVHKLLCEVNAMMRSHVSARGGDGCVGYRVDEMKVIENNKTAYAIVAVSGDAVKLSRNSVT